MMTHRLHVAGNLPIETLVARQLPTNVAFQHTVRPVIILTLQLSVCVVCTSGRSQEASRPQLMNVRSFLCKAKV